MRKHLLAAVCGMLTQPCLAGRPLSTEDAEPIGMGVCELETYAGRIRAEASPDARLSSLQLGCGVIDGSQVALQFQRQRGGDAARQWALVGKTRLHDGQDEAPSLALAWSLGFPKASDSGWPHDTSSLTGVVSWPLTPALTLHANLGWSHSRLARQQRTAWAVALEHALSEQWDVAIETFDDDRSHAPTVQLGLRWAVLADRLWLDASAGRQAHGDHPRTLTAGLRYAF